MECAPCSPPSTTGKHESGKDSALIYLDNNATTPLHPRVLDSMMPFLRDCWANPSSPYRFGHQARDAMEKARERIAKRVGCKTTELVFCSSGTESDNIAIRGVAHALSSKGGHIITSTIEHPAVLDTCKALERDGFRITRLPVNRDGLVDVAMLEASLCNETILVSVMHANNETGAIQPIEKIAAITKKRGILFHTDAVQSTGKLPLHFDGLGADLITFSGHKLHGPKGIAALFVRTGTPLAPVISGGGQERGLRAGTEHVAGIAGLAEAVDMAFEEQEPENRRIGLLRDRLEKQITASIKDTRINAVHAPRIPNTSNICFHGIDGESVVLGLDVLDICASTGSACSTGDPEPSHVLLAMGLSRREAQGAVRFSLGRDTKEDDVNTVVQALSGIVSRLRSISSL